MAVTVREPVTSKTGLAVAGRVITSENGHHIFNRHNKELIIRLEVDGNGSLGMEEDLVVLPQRYIFVVFDLS